MYFHLIKLANEQKDFQYFIHKLNLNFKFSTKFIKKHAKHLSMTGPNNNLIRTFPIIQS